MPELPLRFSRLNGSGKGKDVTEIYIFQNNRIKMFTLCTTLAHPGSLKIVIYETEHFSLKESKIIYKFDICMD